MANQAVFVILAVFFALACGIPDDDAISGYLGCFPDPLLAGYQFGPGYKSDSETVREDCSAFCYGQTMQYAYLRNGECLCDPYGDFTGAAVADSLCDAQVYDGPAGSTNGQYVSAYLTGFSYSFRVLNSCWSKPSGITTVTTTLANNQPATCIAHCSFLNFTAAGVTNGNECSCFAYDDIVSANAASNIVSENNCDIPCPGLWSATCGGANGIDIYPTEGVYLGCYVDTSARVLNQAAPITGTETTVELCQGLCWAGGYLYAGLQDGDQCFCGSNPGTLAPGTDCNTPCAGDSTQTCGGAWRNSVYTAYLTWNYPTQPSGWYQSSSGLFTSNYGTVFGK